jgi:hypothetical protein
MGAVCAGSVGCQQASDLNLERSHVRDEKEPEEAVSLAIPN